MTITKYLSKIIILLFILSLIVLMYLGIFTKGNVKKASPLIDKPAPGFQLKSFNDQNITLEELRGNVLVINFWASWCAPCIKEVRILNKAHSKFENEPVTIIGVNIWDDKQAAKDFMKKYDVSFKNTYDPDGNIQVNYGVAGVPETFFINKEGIIVERYSGELTENILNYFLNKMLNI